MSVERININCRMNKMLFLLVAAAALVETGCFSVSVVVSLPERAAQTLEEMERKVRQDDGDVSFIGTTDDSTTIYAGSPAIRFINKNRKARFKKLKPLFASGAIGEGNNANLQLKDVQNISADDKKAAEKLVKEENDDRENLLKEICKSNDDVRQLMKKDAKDFAEYIRGLYCDVLRKLAEAGWYFQTKEGLWLKKVTSGGPSNFSEEWI